MVIPSRSPEVASAASVWFPRVWCLMWFPSLLLLFFITLWYLTWSHISFHGSSWAPCRGGRSWKRPGSDPRQWTLWMAGGITGSLESCALSNVLGPFFFFLVRSLFPVTPWSWGWKHTNASRWTAAPHWCPFGEGVAGLFVALSFVLISELPYQSSSFPSLLHDRFNT